MSSARASDGPLRVLLVGPCPPPHGGISVHVATARAALRRAGIPCRVVDSGGHRVAGGVAGAPGSLARMMASIDAHARRGYLTHVHANGHSAASFCLALVAAAAARRGTRVITFHSGLLPEYVERSGGAARALARFAATRYHRIVCVSERVRDALSTLGLPRERLAVLPAHLGQPAARCALPESVEGWIASRSPLVSTALFLRPEYGLEVLLDAAARLRAAHPRLGWVVMGDGDRVALAAARQRVADLDLESHVLLTGDLPHAACAAVMARSDLYVRPTLRDGDAISVREALALGVPVVASDAAERPAGTIVHRAGDAADLAAQAGAALAAGRAAAAPVAVDVAGGLDSLLAIYRGASIARVTPSVRFGKRLARLREMSGREIAYRLRDALHVAIDRAPWRARVESDEAFLHGVAASSPPESFLGHLRDMVAPRFYLPASAGDRRAVAELLWRRFPTSITAAAAEAERLCAHRVEILGWGEVALGNTIDWHRDPIDGALWPRRHFADYDTVADPARDVKRVWELNRHQHLPRLGKAYLLSGEERYAAEVVAQMLGWIEQNPKGSGIHWHSSLEIAIRALSWLWALFYVLPSAALDESSARRIGKSLFAQLDHVARYPSIWSSPNTHLIGEAAALYVAGFLFRDSSRGRRWLVLGKWLLEREARRQILDDGMHAELSTYYHCYTVDFYLQALALARRSEHALDETTSTRVESTLDALRSFIGADGVVPLLGDDDGGRALALGASTSYRDARDLLGAGAVLFRRGDWKAQAGTLREEAFWLLGRGAWGAWEALPEQEPSSLDAVLDRAGYVIDEGAGQASGSRLVFDRGDLGKLGGGHGHADALSIVLRAHGEDLLVDAGTAAYNAAPEWRSFFRSTRAHNTLTIDDVDQSTPAGTFRWTRQAATRSLGEGRHPGIRWAAADHDGYGASAGLVHRRRLLSIADGYWLVLDDVYATEGERCGRRQVDLRWHFAPAAEVSLHPVAAASQRGVDAMVRAGAASLHLRVEASTTIAARLVQGATGPAPLQGWVSGRYGERQPAPVLEARVMTNAPVGFVTLLAPSGEKRRSLAAEARSLPVRVLEAGDARASVVALTIPHGRGEDLVVLAPPATLIEAGPCRARAGALWLRIEDDRPTRLLALDATLVEVAHGLAPSAGRRRFVERDEAVNHFWCARESAAAPSIVEERKHVRYRRDR